MFFSRRISEPAPDMKSEGMAGLNRGFELDGRKTISALMAKRQRTRSHPGQFFERNNRPAPAASPGTTKARESSGLLALSNASSTV